MSLTAIISGGQTGADRTGLEVAKEFGFQTGGWAPHEYRTEIGPDPTLQVEFGLLEHPSANYPDRTYANAQISDGTVWFGNIGTAGYKCTKAAVASYEKPWLSNPNGEQLARWILENDIRVLNVAGNRRSRNPEVVQQTRNTLVDMIRLLRRPAVKGV